MYEFAVIGAGISGLSVAHELKKRGVDFVILEGEKIGGKILTERISGKLVDLGPEEIVGSPAFYNLIRELNLQEDLVKPKTTKFAIVRDGKIYSVPSGVAGGIVKINYELLSALFSGLLSWRTLARVLLEPFSKVKGEDLSVNDLFTKLYGKSFVNEFFKPLAGGIYGGDLKVMSSQIYFPYVISIKAKGESLLLSFLRKKVYFELFSFKKGLYQLVEKLKAEIEQNLEEKVVRSVSYEGEYYSIITEKDELKAKKVFITASPYSFPRLINLPDPSKEAKRYIKNSKVAVALAASEDFEEYHIYSGALTYPEVYGISGVTFYDNKWPINELKPPFILKIFLPFEYSYSEKLAQKALNVLETIFKIKKLELIDHKVWHEALPVYTLGASSFIESLRFYENKGLYFTGAFSGSTGITSSYLSAVRTVQRAFGANRR